LLSLYIKDPDLPATACVIWLHGLGADASDMADLVDKLALSPLALRHVFINAPVRPVTINGGMPMRAWYDVTGMSLSAKEDARGITESESAIRKVIHDQYDQGFAYDRIFLAGFSQGGAMALYTGLHTDAVIGGVIALSAYLPLATDCKPCLSLQTPVLMASGQADTVVLPVWTEFARDWLQAQGYTQLTWHQYPMGHSICSQEIKDIAEWLTRQILGE
jgi:phospholipase/carboxylesterase